MYRKRLFQVKIRDNQLIVTLKDAQNLDRLGSAEKLPIMKGWPKTFDLPKAKWATAKIQGAIETELNNHYESGEAKRLAGDIVKSAKSLQQALESQPYREFVMREAGKAGLAGIIIAVPMEIVVQLFQGNPVDWSRVAGVGGLAGASAIGGSIAAQQFLREAQHLQLTEDEWSSLRGELHRLREV